MRDQSRIAPVSYTKRAIALTFALTLLPAVLAACAAPAATQTGPPVETVASVPPAIETAASPARPAVSETAVLESAEPAAETPTAAPTETKSPPPSPQPTAAPLQLEVVQYQTWTDYQSNTRMNVVFHNPYDYAVVPKFHRASLLDSSSQTIRSHQMYFLDGISGGLGFLLPGETIAAQACFNCEQAPISEKWDTEEIVAYIEEATDRFAYETQIEATIADVSFEGESPIFWISGSVTNNSDAALDRISARVIVYDQEGKLIGTAEASAWEVGPGATASFSGYGIGQTPDGPVEYEVTALGVVY